MKKRSQNDLIKEKIYREANLLYREAYAAIRINGMLERMISLAKEHEDAMCLSPYFYQTYYIMGSEYLYVQIVKCLEGYGKTDISVDSLFRKCMKHLDLFCYKRTEEYTPFIITGIYNPILLGSMGEKEHFQGQYSLEIDDFLEEVYKKYFCVNKYDLGASSPFSLEKIAGHNTLEGEFEYMLIFLIMAIIEKSPVIEQIKKYRNKVICHMDTRQHEIIADIKESETWATWKDIEIIFALILEFCSLIMQELNPGSEVGKNTKDQHKTDNMQFTGFAKILTMLSCPADLETTLMVVRQGFAYQDIVKQTIKNGGTLTVTTEELMKKSF